MRVLQPAATHRYNPGVPETPATPNTAEMHRGTGLERGTRGLLLTARLLVDGLYTGRHASPLRGAGVEFHDYRPYTPGDDLRMIDWKLYGRTDRYYLKRFRRETDLSLHVAVDGSASMAFAGLGRKLGGTTGPSKLAVAKQLAAALAVLTARQGDRAGGCLFDQRMRCFHPATGSPRRLQSFIAQLDHAEPTPGQADLGGSLRQLGAVLQRRGLIAVISDLLDTPDPLLRAIDRLRHAGSEVMVFQVLTPDELELTTGGGRGLMLTDPETAQSVQTRPDAVTRRYARLVAEHNEQLRRALATRDIDLTRVRTDRPLLATLRRYLTIRAKRTG